MSEWSRLALCAALVVGGLLAGVYLASGHPLSLMATLVCLITAIPLILQRRRDPFAPWSYVYYFIVLDVLVRSILIDFQITGGVSNLDAIFYLGKPDQFMVDSMWVFLLGFSFLTFGYLAIPERPMPLRAKIFRSDTYDQRKLRSALVFMLLASMIALLVFVRLTFTSVGEFALKMLAQHRGVSDELNEYRAYGYLRLIIGLSSIVTSIAYVRLKTTTESRGFYRAMFTLGLLVACAMAFYSQSRAALLFDFLNLVFMSYYLGGQRFPWKIFLVAAPMLTVVFVLVSGLRNGSGVDLSRQFTPMTAVAPIVLTTSGIDASKTGHVIDYVNETQDYKFGETLVQFIAAMVPREIWPDKPPNLDTYIGEKIYGEDVFGDAAVPPGFFAEMYMNFWYAGIVLGAVVFGAFLRYLHNVLVSNRRNANFVLVYVTALQNIGLGILGSGVSSTIIGVMMTGVPLVLALNYITVRQRRVPLTTYA